MKLKQKKIRGRQQITLEKSADQESVQNDGAMENKRKSKKSGYVVIFCGVIMLLTGSWLFSQTWELRLLSADVWIGRISKYYGGFLMISGICFVMGFWTIMHTARPLGKKTDSEIAKETFIQTSAQIGLIKELSNCPVCGKVNDPVNKFCTSCGSRVKETE